MAVYCVDWDTPANQPGRQGESRQFISHVICSTNPSVYWSVNAPGGAGRKASMQKWLYKRDAVHTEEEIGEKLSNWGNLGWELVSVCHIREEVGYVATGEAQAPPPWKLFFKRPAP